MFSDYLGKLSDREKKIFFVAVGFILLSLLHGLIIMPILNLKKEPGEEAIFLEGKLEEYNRLIKEAGIMVKETGISTPLDIEKQIYATASSKDSFITIKQIYPEKSSRRGEEKKVSLVVTAEGRLDRMLNFMQKLERLPYLVYIEKFEMHSPTGLEGSSTTACVMTISHRPLSHGRLEPRQVTIKVTEPEVEVSPVEPKEEVDLSLQGVLKRGDVLEAIVTDKKTGSIQYLKKGATLGELEVTDIQWDRIILQDKKSIKTELLLNK